MWAFDLRCVYMARRIRDYDRAKGVAEERGLGQVHVAAAEEGGRGCLGDIMR